MADPNVNLRLPDWTAWFRTHSEHGAKNRSEYDLHLAAHEWALGSSLDINGRGDFQSLRHLAVEPFAHQVENAIRYFQRLAPRGLIADDVGLGKTITAGLIAAELLERGRVESILIVCPKAILGQWEEELRTKFSIQAQAATGQDFQNLHKHPHWITTYATARSKMALIKERKFDLLILDEAHALRNLYNDPPPKTAVAFRELMLVEGARFVLMLTATPIQNRLWDIYSLLDICRAPQPNPLGTPQHFLSTYVADHPQARQLRSSQRDDFRRRLGEVSTRTRRSDTNLLFPTREVRDERLVPEREEKDFLQQALAAIISMPPLVQITHARTLMSSPWAAAAAFDRAANDPRYPSDVRQELSRLAGIGRGISQSAKTGRVLEFARQLKAHTGPSRLIVFTMRTETLNHLHTVLSENGFQDQVSIFKGGQDHANRKAIEDFMADPPTRPILLSTDAGAVGLNLQAGNVVINYDLPWNPMLIEQRIGRVQRLGQKAEKVIVYNLVLAGTIEERIVLRLMEKLNLFNQAIGEMEELLELTGFDDDEGQSSRSLENVIMELVRKAAQQIDVEAQFRQMEHSRRQAELKLKEMREATDQALKSIRPTDGEVRLQNLPRIQPRLALEPFVQALLEHHFAEVRPQGSGRFAARLGMNWKTFIVARPSESGETNVQHIAPGTRQFDELASRFRTKIAHHVLDGRGVTIDRLQQTLMDRLSLCGLVVESVVDKSREQLPAAISTIKLTAKVSTDQFQTLTTVKSANTEHGIDALLEAHLAGTTTTEGLPLLAALDGEWGQQGRQLDQASQAAVKLTEGVTTFCDFYLSRRSEEIGRLHEQQGLPVDAKRKAEEAVRFRFTPEVTIEPISVAGLTYEVVHGEALTRGRSQHESSPLPFAGVPLTGVLTQAPTTEVSEPWVCPGRHIVDKADFVTCSVEDCTKGSCQSCSKTLRILEQCGDCDSLLCDSHKQTCVACKKALCPNHALVLDVGMGYVCSDCSDVLADGRRVLKAQEEVSAVSRRRGYRPEMVKSAVSDRWGFAEEVVHCEESGRALMPDESVVCALTGERVGIDLTEESAVSSRRALRSRMGRSRLGGDYFIPGEQAVCEETGDEILPSETDRCERTHKKVRRDLLEEDATTHAPVLKHLLGRSQVTQRGALPEHLVASQKTGRLGLPDEIRRCGVCLLSILVDEGLVCSETNHFACREHFLSCEVSGQLVLAEGLARCDITGKLAARSLLSQCPDTGRQAQTALLEKCERTGVLVVPEALGICAVSGERVRKSLLIPCEETGQLALQDNLETCGISGKRVLPERLITCPDTGTHMLPAMAELCEESGIRCAPDAIVSCAVTGRRVRRSLMATDDVDGRLVLPSLLKVCQRSGKRTLAERLVTCSVTGKRALPEFMTPCAVSGQPALLEALERCDVTGQLVRPGLLFSCPETGKRLLRTVAATCEATGALVNPEATAVCQSTGQRVRRSLLSADEVSKRLVLASLLRACEQTGRRTLPENLVRSAVSGKEVLEEIAARCAATGAWALPEELQTCTVTNDRLLPGLMGRCSESGDIVARRVLVTCEASGQSARPEFLGTCSVTGKRVLKRLLRPSELSGALTLDEALATCASTGKRVLPSELAEVEVGSKRVCSDRIVRCHVCARTADSSDIVLCRACNQRVCADHHHNLVCESCRILLVDDAGRTPTATEEAVVSSLLDGYKVRHVVDSATYCHVLARRTGIFQRGAERMLVFPRVAGQLSNTTGSIVDRPIDKESREELS